MSLIATNPLCKSCSPKNWIAPEMQLEKCRLSVARKVQNATGLAIDAAKLVTEYTSVDDPATYSLNALSQLNALPQAIPPLPENIHDILDEDCPISHWNKTELPIKVGRSHLLVLVPQEFGSINRLIENILEPGRENIPHLEPFALTFAMFDGQKEYGDTPFKTSHWVLVSLKFLQETKDSWKEKKEIVDVLNKKYNVSYKIPDLQQIIVSAVICRIINPPSPDRRFLDWTNSHFTAILPETLCKSKKHLSFAGGCERNMQQMVVSNVKFEDCACTALLREL
ncbi:MAG TPA: hypothetical protein VGO47_03520 [Chlamydiales bacterium]|jgi:hypothetical protein|nr:hypothetical protein [Chlamydiales bacterium]